MNVVTSDKVTFANVMQIELSDSCIEKLAEAFGRRKTGKWRRMGWSIKCSECGYDMPFAVRNYCPSCGARMEEEQ